LKRAWQYIIGLILVAGAATGVILAVNSSKNHDDNSQPASVQKKPAANIAAQKQACGIFTLADAKQLLGDSAKGGENPADTSSQDVDVTVCNYLQDLSSSNVPVSSGKSASLTVKIPKTEDGIKSNQGQFGIVKPGDVQDVSGYGDNAYWDPTHGQLDILKNNTWYILSNGSITPSARTLDEAKQLADLLIGKM
jgi:hypothetical protein